MSDSDVEVGSDIFSTPTVQNNPPHLAYQRVLDTSTHAAGAPSFLWPSVEVCGIPKELCNEKILEVMLEQALGTKQAFFDRRFQIVEPGHVIFMHDNFFLALQCFNHFSQCAWPNSALKVNMCVVSTAAPDALPATDVDAGTETPPSDASHWNLPYSFMSRAASDSSTDSDTGTSAIQLQNKMIQAQNDLLVKQNEEMSRLNQEMAQKMQSMVSCLLEQPVHSVNAQNEKMPWIPDDEASQDLDSSPQSSGRFTVSLASDREEIEHDA